jgi:hypothetical protein
VPDNPIEVPPAPKKAPRKANGSLGKFIQKKDMIDGKLLADLDIDERLKASLLEEIKEAGEFKGKQIADALVAAINRQLLRGDIRWAKLFLDRPPAVKTKEEKEDSHPSFSVTDARKKTYLLALSRTGLVGQSAAKAGVSTMAVSKWRHEAKDAVEFNELEKAARENFVERLEREMVRRAIEGTSKPIYYKGRKVGEELVKSDTLLICLAKANSPKYQEALRIGGTGEPIRVLSLGVNLDAKEVHDAVDQLLVAAAIKEAGSNGGGGNGRLAGRNGTSGTSG